MTLWVILVKEPVCRGGKGHGAWSMEHGARSREQGARSREQGATELNPPGAVADAGKVKFCRQSCFSRIDLSQSGHEIVGMPAFDN
jgi:hypothetical protein